MTADEGSVRVDVWIWSVRLAKSRSAATTEARLGRVRVNGKRVKASHALRLEDEVRVRQGDRERIVKVRRLLSKRVGAPVAVECYSDHSPPAPERPVVPPVPRRDPGAGRPTKRERREIERLRGER